MAVIGSRVSSLFNDSNGDGKVSPNDTLITHILINNATASPITTVTVNDTLTSNTTYVAGTIVVTVGDQYTGLVGNTPITFGTGEGVLANDYHFDGVNAGTNSGLTVATVNGTAIGAAITIHDAAVPATVAGTVDVHADGSFTFTPATGYVGTAAFTYADSDGSGTVGTGTVTLTVSSEIWYVDSAYAGANGASDGSYLKPFTNFTNLNGAGDKDNPGDAIVVHGSPVGALTLEAGETLYGDAVQHNVNDAYAVNGVTHNTGQTTVTSGSGTSTMNAAAVAVITLSTNNTIDGITVNTNGATAGIVDNGGSVTTAGGTLTIAHTAVSGNAQGVSITHGGNLAASFTGISSSGGAIGIALAGTASSGTGLLSGSFTSTGGTITGNTGVGVLIGSATASSGGTADISYGGTVTNAGTDAVQVLNKTGGTTTFSGNITTTGTAGIDVTGNSGGTVNFTGQSISVTSTTGTGINLATNTGATVNFNPTAGGNGLDVTATTGAGIVFTGGGTLNVQGSGNSVSTTTGHILDFANGTIGANNVTFASLTASAQVVGTAISLNNIDGGTFNGGVVSILGASADGIAVAGGSTSAITFGNTTIGTGAGTIGSDGISVTSNTGSNVTFNGTVAITTNGGGQGINLDTDTGTIAFTGTTKTITASSGDGIHIASNGAAVSFTNGGLTVTTTSGDGIDAAGTTPSATNALTISGNTNQINTTSGIGVKIDGVQTDVTLQGVKVTAAATDGIYINNGGITAASKFVIQGTGTAASNTLTGTGAAATDGNHLQGTGIYLNSIGNVDLTKVTIAGDWNNFGIRGDSVYGFKLHDSTLNGTYGDSNAADEGAIRFGAQAGSSEGAKSGIIGTGLFEGNTIGGGWEDNLDLYLYGSDTANITVKDNATSGAQAVFNTTQNPLTNGSGNDNITVESGGNSTLTLTLDGLDVKGAHGDQLQIVASDNTTQHLTVTNSSFNNFTQNSNTIGGGVYIGGGGDTATYHVDFNFTGNTIKYSKDTAAAFIYGGNSQVVSGIIQNNTIGTASGGGATLTDGSGSQNGIGIEVDSIHQAGAGQSKVAVRIQGNQIHDWSNLSGIALYATGNAGDTGSEILEATVLNNVVDEGDNAGGASLAAFYAWAGSKNPGDNGVIGLNLSGNTFTPPSGALAAIDLDQLSTNNIAHYNIPGYNNAGNANHGESHPAGGTASTSLQTFWGSSNTLGTAPSPIYGNGTVYAGTTAGITNSAFTLGVPLLVATPAPADPTDPVSEQADDTQTVTNTDGDPNAGGGGTTGGSAGSTSTDTGSTGTATPAAPSSTISHNLSQADLDQMVQAAIHRWELAGATPEQIAAMQAVSVTVSDIAGLAVGDSTPGHILVSSTGAGYGWFVDATPDDDSEFSGTGTDLTAEPGTLPYGHVDLLTVIEHELGHQIGLLDDYNSADAADLMYGFVNTSERRIAAHSDVAAATGTPIDHESFALAQVSIPTIAAGNSVDVSFRSTVNSFSPGFVPTLTASSTLNYQGLGAPLTTSETTNLVNTTRTATDGTVTTAALVEASLTLGNLVYKDNDKDGAFGAGDTGIGNVTVKLYIDNGTSAGVWDASDTLVTTTTTSNVAGTLGQYSFTGLAPGDYIVVVPSTNFGAGPLGALVPHSGALDPDNNVDNDNNGIAVAGGNVASLPITLAFDTEPTAGAGNDTNNTLDFGFQTNSPPVANADTLAATDEDTPATYAATAFTGNDSDPDGDTFSITGVSNGSHGTAVLNGDGTVTYTPNSNYNGSDTFTYTITDSHGATATANATVTVNAVNDPVTGTAPATATVNEDSSGNPITGMSISDVDATLAPAGVYEVTVAATHGTLTLTTVTGLTFSAGDGAIDTTMTFHGTLAAINTALASAHYTPDANYNGAAQIQLDVTDTYGGTVATGTGSATNDSDVIAVTVTSVNDAPVVTDESATTNDTTDHVFASADFTAHFSDPNDTPANAPLNVIITSLPATGTLTYNGTAITAGQVPYTISVTDLDAGKLHYAPAAASGGSDYSFGFKVEDDGGTANSGQDTSSAHIFTMHVTVSDFAPVLDLDTTAGGIDNNAAYTEQAAPTILASTLALSDSDDTDLTGATVSVGTGFQANTDYLTVNGSTGDTINGITFSYNAATGVLTFSGTASIADYQSLLQQVGFESTSDAPGTSRDIAWTVTDGTLPSTTAHTSVAVTPVNDAPSGADATISFSEDATRILHASDFGYTDPDGDPMASVTISSVSGGTLYYDSDGAGGNPPVAVSSYPATFTTADLAGNKVSFVPTADLNGTGVGSIVFAVTDNSGQANDTDTSPNTLTIDLTAVNDAPVASGSATAATINEDTASVVGETVGSLFSANFSDTADDQTAHTGGSSANTLAGVAVTANASSAGTGHWQYWNGASWVDISTGVSTSSALLLGASTALRFNPAQDYNGAAPTLTVSLIDSSGGAVATGSSVDLSGPGATGGTTAYSVASVVLADTVDPVNDAPVNHVPAAQSVDEDAALTFDSGHSNAITVSDVDVGAGSLMTTVSVLHGTVTLGGTNNVAVTGNGTNSVQLTGSAADINTALSGLTYAPAGNYNGGDTLTVVTGDSGNTGSGGAKSDTDSVAITVAAVNDQPVVSDGADIAATEQTAITVNASTAISDIDLDAFNGGNGDYAGATLTYDRSGGANAEDSFTIPNGAGFTVSGNNLLAGGLVFATFTTSATPGELKITFTSSGTPATTALVNAVAQAVQYTNTSDTPPASVDLVYTLNDGSVVNNNQGSNASPFNAFDPGFVHVTIAAVNDAPVNTVPGGQTLNEDSTKTFSSANSNAITVADADVGGGNLTTTISVLHGTLTLGGTSNVSVTGNGTGSVQVTGTAADINAALNGTVYAPTGNFNGSDTLTVLTGDNGNTGTGGTQTGSDTVALTVNAVNDAPTVVNGTTATAPAINEDTPSPTGDTVSSLFGSHYSDATDNQSATGGSSAGAFTGVAITANGSGATGDWQYWNGASWVNIGAVSSSSAMTLAAGTAIRFNPALNYNGPAPTLTVHLADNTASITDGSHINLSGGGATGGTTPWSTGTVDLGETVSPVNDPPVVDLNGAAAGTGSTISYTEGDPIKLVAPATTVTDVDSPNYANAVLTLAFTANGTPDDRLIVIDHGALHNGDINVDEGNIYYQFGFVSGSGTVADPYDYSNSDIRLIGTYIGGNDGSDLVITLTADATPAIAQKLLADIGYENVSNAPSEATRTVTVTLAESDGATSIPADITINVTGIDNPATAVNDQVATDENTILQGSVFGNDFDSDGPPLQVSQVNGSAANVGQTITLASGATIKLNADGTFTYDPNHKFDTLTSPSGGETGASNTSAADSFTYTLAGGNTATVTVTVNGVANAADHLDGSADNDIIHGTPNADYFDFSQGGSDSGFGLGGNDAFYFGDAYDQDDKVDGGAGTDTVGIRGNYTGGNALTILAGNMINTEVLSLMTSTGGPVGYDITWQDGNLATNQKMAIYAGNLQPGENVTFDGSAETHGYFIMYGGLGTDNFTGGAGSDGFYFGPGKFTQSDHVDGGGGTQNQLGLDGSYNFSSSSALGTLGGNFTNIQTIVLYNGNPADFADPYPNVYHIETNDAAVAAGKTLAIYGTQTTADFYFNGSAETDGSFKIYGGSGSDTLIGGANADLLFGGTGADTLTGGGGNDFFLFTEVNQSTAASPDRITDFTAGDRIDLSQIDADTTTSGHQSFTFIGSGAFTDHAGELRAEFDAVHNVWTVQGDVDGDGHADLTILVTTTGGHAITGADFFP
jgi:hypothetical protein